MDIAQWLLFTLWGLSAGVVMAHGDGPRRSGLLIAVALLQSVGAVYIVFTSASTEPQVLIAATFGYFAGAFLAGAHVWRDEPTVGDRPFWSRAAYVSVNAGRLPRSQQTRGRTPEHV